MLRLNVNEEKKLTFEVQIGGVTYDSLVSKFKIILGEIEYGFPAKVGRETITVDLPPLKKIIGAKINEGDEAEVKLELIADGRYLTPWQDSARLSNPLVVEAKIKDDAFQEKPALKTKLIVSEDGATQTTVIDESQNLSEEDDLTNKIVDKLSKKFQKLLVQKEQDEMPSPMEAEDEDKEDEVEEGCKVKEEVEVKEESTAKALDRLLNKTIDALNLSESRTDKNKKKITLEEFKKNLSEEDIKRYIAAKGSKNPKIQEIIYEQAKLSAKKDTPAHILQEVVKLIRKK